MSLHFNTFSTLLLMSGVAALLVSLLLFQRKQAAIFWFALMMLASAVWAIAYSFELSSHSLEQMLIWIDVEYLGISFLPATWIFFVVHFIGKDEWLTFRNRLLIFIFPVLAVLLVWTNQWHHIHYESVSIDTSGPFPMLSIEPGPWYHVHTVYFYFLLIWGMVLLARHYAKSDLIYRKQTRIVLIGACVPWLTNFFYLLGIRPYDHIDATPYAFILTTLIISFGLMRYKLFSVVPFARDQLIENIREGMMVLDTNRRIIDLNPAMRRFLSAYGQQLVGQRLDEVLPTHYALQHLIMRPGGGREEVTLSGEKKERFYEVSSTPLFNSEKDNIGTLLVFWDVTSRRWSIETLRAQAQELESLNELKNRMFSIIAHDLRTPLASLINILNMVESGGITEEELKGVLPMLSTNVDYTSNLLDNLLHWSKSQLQGEHMHPLKFRIREVVDPTFEFFVKKASEKGVVLENQIDPTSEVFADKNMVDVVVRNLINNAVKFTRAGDTIRLQSNSQEGKIRVQVSDTGVGMDDETKAKLFGLGVSSKAGTMEEKGTGLGLKLCRDFIVKNKGAIWVESEVGKGSTFTFELPSSSLQA